jgi:hypothetical protein
LQTVVVSDEPDVIIETIIENRTYDRYGRESGGKRTTKTSGMLASGQAINVEVVSSLNDVVVVDDSLSAYTNVIKTSGNGPIGEVLDTEESTIFSDMTLTSWQEERVNGDHRIQVTRTGIKRNNTGQIIKYRDEIDDNATPFGVMIIVRDNTSFNARGEMLSYHETNTDILGLITEKNVVGIIYSGLGQMISFVETHEGDVNQNIIRYNSGYDVLGRLVAYENGQTTDGIDRENLINWQAKEFNNNNKVSKEVTTTKIDDKQTIINTRNNIVYNNFEQITDYQEEITDSNSPNLTTTKQVLGTIYDNAGQIAEHLVVTDFDGSTTQMFQGAATTVSIDLTTTTTKNNAVYDSSGRLIGYTETTKSQDHTNHLNPEKISSRIRQNIEYQENTAQMVAYKDILKDNSSSDLTTTVDTKDTIYDAYGRALSYKETTTTIGAGDSFFDEVTRIRVNTIYNAKGEELSYQDQIYRNDILDIEIMRLGMNYDALGRLEGFKIITSDWDNDAGRFVYVVEETVSDITRNGLAQEISKKQNIKTKAFEDDGVLIFDEEENINKQEIIYDSFGSVISSYEVRKKVGDNFETKILTEDTVYDELGRSKSLKQTVMDNFTIEVRERKVTEYNSLGQVTKTIEDVIASDKSGILTTETTSGITYNQSGLQTSFVKNIKEESAGLFEVETTITRSNVGYDDNKNISGYQEAMVQTSPTGVNLITNTTRTGMNYDNAKLLSAYHEEISGNSATDTTADWQGAYDLSGRMSTFVKTDEIDEQVVTTTRQATNYNTFNQVTDFSEEIVKDIGDTQVTTNIKRSNINYNADGLLDNYEENFVNSNSAEMQTISSRSSTTYNNLGQIIEKQENIKTQGGGLDIEKDITLKNQSFDLFGLVLSSEQTIDDISNNTKQIITKNNISYNTIVQEVSYKETARETAIDVITQTERTGIGYDHYGTVVSYNDIIHSTATPELKEEISYTATTDIYGIMTNYERDSTVINRLGFDDYLVNNNVKRENITYNTDYQMQTFKETIINGDIVSEVLRSETFYNTIGKELALKEDRTRYSIDGKIDTEQTVEKKDIIYDMRGYEAGYQEIIEDDFTTTRNWTGTYDDYGQLYSFVDSSRKQADGFDVTTIVTRLSTSYNLSKQLDGQIQTMVSEDAPEVTVKETLSDIVYDDRGQKLSYTKTENKKNDDDSFLDFTETTTRLATGYDDKSRETGFRNQVISSESPDIVTDILRSGIVYNNLDQLIAYEETTNKASTTSDFNSSNTVYKNDLTYSNEENLLSYTERRVSAGTEVNLTWSGTYNDLNQLVTTTESGTGPDLEVFSKDWEGAYDDKGRLEIFDEEIESLKNGDSQKHRTAIIYNNNGQIANYSETGSSLGVSSYNKTWTGLGYTLSGREAHYLETLTDDLGKTTNREWQNAGYNTEGRLIYYEESSDINVSDLEKTHTFKTWTAGGDFDESGNIENYTETLNRDYYDQETDEIIYHETINKNWSEGVYISGNLTEFSETENRLVKNASAELVLNTDSSFTRSDIKYDGLDRMTKYTEIGSSSSAGNYDKNWEVTGFDTDNRSTGYTEHGYSSSGGPYDLVRTNIAYETHGFVTGYNENGWSNSQFVDRSWSAGVNDYDALGRVISWSETGFNEAGEYRKTQAETDYNVLSQMLGYTETGFNVSEANYTKTVTNLQYNTAGGRKFYDQVNLNKGKKTESIWQGSYNVLNQLISQNQADTIYKNAEIIETSTMHWTATDADYTAIGQSIGFTRTTDRTACDETYQTIQKRLSTSFDVLGRVTDYREQYDGTDGKREVIREDVVYYTSTDEALNALHREGMQKGYLETSISDSAEEKIIQTIVDDNKYNDRGYLINSLTASAEENLVFGLLRLT